MASVNLTREEIINNLNSGDGAVRNNAIVAAGEMCDNEINQMIEKLCNASDPATRYFAKKTLKKIKDSQQKTETETGIAPSVSGFNFETIKTLLSSPLPENRQRAMKALTVNFNPAVLPLLIEMLKNEKDPFVIASLVKLAGKYGGTEMVEPISAFLNHDDPRVRANAIEGLEFIGTEKIIPYIVPFINDVDNRIKANAVKAISRFKSDEVIEVLGSMIKSEQLWMRDSAIFALQQIGSDQAVDLLCLAARDIEKSISNNALQALVRIGSVYALKKVDELRNLQKEKTAAPIIKKIINSNESASETKPAEVQTAELKADETKSEKIARETPRPQEAENRQPSHGAETNEVRNAVKNQKNDGAFEKLKAKISKKETALINIIKEEDSAIMANFKIDLDDNFTSYVNDIQYVPLAPAQISEKKKPAAEKPEEDIMAGAVIKTGSAENAAKLSNEAKKKLLLDSLNKPKGKTKK